MTFGHIKRCALLSGQCLHVSTVDQFQMADDATYMVLALVGLLQV